jgi:hypothetical protein
MGMTAKSGCRNSAPWKATPGPAVSGPHLSVALIMRLFQEGDKMAVIDEDLQNLIQKISRVYGWIYETTVNDNISDSEKLERVRQAGYNFGEITANWIQSNYNTSVADVVQQFGNTISALPPNPD